MVVDETKKYQLHRLHDASYGAMLSVKNLYNGNLNDYSFLYIELPEPTHKQGLHIQPKGKYLRAFCKGDWSKIPTRYEEILSYAYEKGLNELVIDTFDDYITQIEIPVQTE